MKFMAFLLIGCMLFLSAFSGEANATPSAAIMDCCKNTAVKDTCHHQPVKETNGCEKQGCAMLFSCSICACIPVATLRLPSNISFILLQPFPHYTTGDLSAYHKADWKPPKPC